MTEGLRVGRADDPDHYALGQSVASGGEAILYRGAVPGPGGEIDVAIKVPLPEFEGHLDVLFERWKEQVELLRSLRHPGIVPVRETFIGPPPHRRGERANGRQLYLVMDWVDGRPLDEWLLDHPEANYLQRVRQLAQIADVLDRVHALELTGAEAIVHRDVKPNNIIMGSTGPVLVDWGLVRGVVPDASARPGEGTPAFMAPEVRHQGVYSPASDRYSFGCVIFYVLTGQYPPEDHPLDAMKASLLAVPGMERQYATVEHILAMLNPIPGERPASCRNWLAGIARTTVVGIDSVPPRFPSATTDPPPRRRRNVLAGALALVVLSLVALVVVNRGPGSPEAAGGLPGPSASTSSTSTPTSSPTTTMVSATTTTISNTTVTTPATTTTAISNIQTPPVSSIYLDQLTPVAGYADRGRASMNGTLYLHALALNSCCSASVEYDLSRSWKQLSVTIGVRDDAPAVGKGLYTIYLDNAQAHTGDLRFGASAPLRLDVTNVLRLRLEITDLTKQPCCAAAPYYVFGDPQLSR